MTDQMPSLDKMTNDEFHTFVLEQMMQGWMPLKTYMRYFPSETKLAIEARLARGVWERGVHYTTPPRGAPWVNIIAIRKWVTGDETKLASESLASSVVSLEG